MSDDKGLNPMYKTQNFWNKWGSCHITKGFLQVILSQMRYLRMKRSSQRNSLTLFSSVSDYISIRNHNKHLWSITFYTTPSYVLSTVLLEFPKWTLGHILPSFLYLWKEGDTDVGFRLPATLGFKSSSLSGLWPRRHFPPYIKDEYRKQLWCCKLWKERCLHCLSLLLQVRCLQWGEGGCFPRVIHLMSGTGSNIHLPANANTNMTTLVPIIYSGI